MNDRPFQALIDPSADLAAQNESLLPASWIVPLEALGGRQRLAPGAKYQGVDRASAEEFSGEGPLRKCLPPRRLLR